MTLEQIADVYKEYASEQKIESFGKTKLFDPIYYSLSIAGKQLRPFLALCAHYGASGEVKNCFDLAHALEVFHNFTLVHDDIMDNANIRRGNPSAFAKYGVNEALLSGDAMLIYVYSLILKGSNPKFLPKILDIFNKMAINVCIGQQADMEFEKQTSVQEPEYLKMILNKTAVLIGAALEIGAIQGEASESDAKNLKIFGEKIGVAFQIQDDFLDFYGKTHVIGKLQGGDIQNKKKTYLIIKAMQKLNLEFQTELIQILDSMQMPLHQKLERITFIFEQINLKLIVEDEISNRVNEALELLSHISIREDSKQILISWTKALHKRIH